MLIIGLLTCLRWNWNWCPNHWRNANLWGCPRQPILLPEASSTHQPQALDLHKKCPHLRYSIGMRANHIVMQASCPELRRLIGKNQISMTSQEVWWNRLWCWPYYRSPWGLFWSKVCLEWSQKSEKKSLVKRQSGNKELLWPHQQQWDGGKGFWQAWIRIQGSCVVAMIETKM